MLVDVLVPVVLVALEAQRRQLGQDQRRRVPVSTIRVSPRRGSGESRIFTSSSRIRSAETIESRSAMSVIAATTPGSTVRPSSAANRAARIIRSGSSENDSSGVPGVRSTPAARSRWPPNGSTNSRGAELEGHRVDREVPPGEVAEQGVAEGHGGLARRRLVGVRPVGRDLELPVADPGADGAELTPDVPGRVGPAGEAALDLVRARRRGEVQVVLVGSADPAARREPTRRPGRSSAPPSRTGCPPRRSPAPPASARARRSAGSRQGGARGSTRCTTV